MTIEEINKVFDFLYKTFDLNDEIYFKMNSGGNINVYWKNTDKLFAEFYTNRILEYIKEQERETN